MTKAERRMMRQILKQKAAAVNLTYNHFVLLVQLGGDLCEHSSEAVQPMVFQRTEWGCEMILLSINASYRVQVWKADNRLKCICERFGMGSALIHDSDDGVMEWELLRKRILWLEGVETMTQNDFQTIKMIEEIV
jgi:hypothetical protein